MKWHFNRVKTYRHYYNMQGMLAYHSQNGFTMIEVVTTVAMLGIIGVTALSGLASLISSGDIVSDRAIAIAFAQRQLEYVKTLNYQAAPASYAVLDINPPYQLSCNSQQMTDGNIQKVVVTVSKDNRVIFTIEDIKVNR